jgi:putative ABC transport system substrate-binding protein
MPIHEMKRRELIALLVGAAAWPLAARAQRATLPVVGLLRASPPPAPLLAGFQQGLKEAGFVEGQNFVFEYRFGDCQ